MSTSPDDRATSRAEARRRARMAARGELPEDEVDASDEPVADAQGGSFLGRLFPPAPPLPNKPSPLAGFDESGPLRPVRVRAFLLRRNLPAWVVTGVVAAAGYFASIFYGPGGEILSLVGTFVLFGAIIAAGWFGWQRPALYGTAAAILSFTLVAIFFFVTSAMAGVTPDVFGEPGEVVTGLAVQGLYQGVLGFLGGWYGGYLRRRQTQLSTDRARQARRR
jgi:hypothetical protein